MGMGRRGWQVFTSATGPFPLILAVLLTVMIHPSGTYYNCIVPLKPTSQDLSPQLGSNLQADWWQAARNLHRSGAGGV